MNDNQERDPSRRGPSDPSSNPPDPRMGCIRGLFWAFLLFLTYTLVRQFTAPAADATTLPYTAFTQELRDDNVVEVTVQGEEVRGILRAPVEWVEEGDTAEVTEFVTYMPSFGDPDLLARLDEAGVEVRTLPERDTTWIQLLLWGVLPILILGGIMLFVLRGMAGRAQSFLSIGKSQAKEHEREGPQTTFDDVAGAAGAKSELQEIVAFLKEPARFHALGAEVPKGVLLVGPPGTGKTLLARAVAGEADVSFFVITGSDFMEMFVGVGAKRVRALFDQAKENAPSIIFIDELDSIGRQRGTGLGGGHDEREQTLNQLLSELDGFEPAENVIVMAASNRPDILDPALLRPGRFDRRISVDLPSAGERLEILRLHARELPLEPEVDLDPLARGTPGFSGADLKNVLNEAALAAARHGKTRIGPGEIEGAHDRILLGLEREGLALTDDEMRLLAYHEGGHAIVAATLPNTDPVHKVTIVPRGRAMGTTHQLPERERYIWRREDLLDQLALLLGGRAAEDLVFGTVTSGAEDDLQRATETARRMVSRWGMSDSLGPFSSGGPEEVFIGQQLARGRDHSEATARAVDGEVRRILDDAANRARETLEQHRDALEQVVALLLEKEEVSGDEVAEALGRKDA
ncbi:MAG: ATP-dependent zinc metalloprotease FtsH [Gemmatimonadota bacterium]|nr:ATP-dependent zinc metalloprotease FtsH [Gemmatimonadota bacterium]